MYDLLKVALGVKLDPEMCQLVVTVCAFNKTLANLPQGEPNVTLTIDPPVPSTSRLMYFGMFKHGPLTNYTDPFSHPDHTSEDGGAVFLNVPPSDKPYVITAHKPGKVFSQSTLLCRKGMVANASPPQGPNVLNQD